MNKTKILIYGIVVIIFIATSLVVSFIFASKAENKAPTQTLTTNNVEENLNNLFNDYIQLNMKLKSKKEKAEKELNRIISEIKTIEIEINSLEKKINEKLSEIDIVIKKQNTGDEVLNKFIKMFEQKNKNNIEKEELRKSNNTIIEY